MKDDKETPEEFVERVKALLETDSNAIDKIKFLKFELKKYKSQ